MESVTLMSDEGAWLTAVACPVRHAECRTAIMILEFCIINELRARRSCNAPGSPPSPQGYLKQTLDSLPLSFAGGSTPGGSPLAGTPRGFGAQHAELPAAPTSAQRRLDFRAKPGEQPEAAASEQQEARAGSNVSQHAESAGAAQQPATASDDAKQDAESRYRAVAQAGVPAKRGTGAAGAVALPTPEARPGSAVADALQAELQALCSQNAKLQQQVRLGWQCIFADGWSPAVGVPCLPMWVRAAGSQPRVCRH